MPFASELRKRGVAQGTICRNWEFDLLEQRLWNALGFDTIAARTNCDRHAMLVDEREIRDRPAPGLPFDALLGLVVRHRGGQRTG